MSLWEIDEGLIVAGLVVVALLLAAGGLMLVLRPASAQAEEKEAPKAEERPLPLERVRQEGFEVVEIYNDVVAVKPSLGASPTAFARTAKVRDPESGALRLLRVLTPHQTAR